MSKSINTKRITSLFVITFALLVGATLSASCVDAYAANLSAPVVTAVNSSPTSVKLSWKKVSGAKKYTVYRSNKKSSGYKSITTTTKLNYTNKKLTCGKKYYYKVVAVNAGKKASSKVVSVTAKPAKVGGVKTSADCKSIKISWKSSSSVSGYDVYCVSNKKRLTTTASTSYKHTKLKINTEKSYKIRAYKKVGNKKVYGDYSVVVTDRTNHIPAKSWTVDKKPDCTNTGSRSNKCATCGAKYSEAIEIDPSKHELVTTTNPAGCTTEGSVVVSCSRCSKVISTKTVVATGHNIVSLNNAITPTCTSNGKESDSKCSGCDLFVEGDVIPAKRHIKVSANNAVAATCTEAGHYSDTICQTCGCVLEYGNVIPAKGHVEIYADNGIEPTCTQNGKAPDIICWKCNAVIKEGSILDKKEHTPRLAHNPVEPTCTAGHEEDTICADCGVLIQAGNELPAIYEHEYEKYEAVASTQTQAGYVVYKCKWCDDKLNVPVDVADHEHNWVHVDGMEPNCDGSGCKDYEECSICGAVNLYESIPPEHSFTEWEGIQEEYDLDGRVFSHLRVCELCGYVEFGDCEYGDFVVEEEATCSKEGRMTRECAVCHSVDKVAIPIKQCAHKNTVIKNEVPAKCGVDGYTGDVYCNDCQKTIMRGDVIFSTPHSYSEQYTVNNEGCLEYKCLNCDSVKIEKVCIINLTDQTITTSSVKPELAYFEKSANQNDKLVIQPDGEFDFEIVGERNNLTIHVDSKYDTDIKLSGVKIVNNGRSAFDIKSVGEVTENDGSVRVPEISISAKDETVNEITITQSGNAFESECSLNFKGHGKLIMNTESTAISTSAKISIKNLYMYIVTKNRGIDTKFVDSNSQEQYYNIKIGSNAIIIIESEDDCIRCKNLEVSKIDLSQGDVATELTLTTNNGDGIQLEGKTGIVAESGKFKINVKNNSKYIFNCRASRINIISPATVSKVGDAQYCKPDKEQ